MSASAPRYKKALLPGSYDPVTLGHMAIIRRACALCEQVVVGVFVNPEKVCRYPVEKRAEMLRAACAGLGQVRVVCDGGFVADYAKSQGCDIIIKGYRNENDLAYEKQMADYNLGRGGVPTLLLPCEPAFSALSSTEVRRRLAAGEMPDGLVPPEILPLL